MAWKRAKEWQTFKQQQQPILLVISHTFKCILMSKV